jgi:hypothetical protein
MFLMIIKDHGDIILIKIRYTCHRFSSFQIDLYFSETQINLLFTSLAVQKPISRRNQDEYYLEINNNCAGSLPTRFVSLLRFNFSKHCMKTNSRNSRKKN